MSLFRKYFPMASITFLLMAVIFSCEKWDDGYAKDVNQNLSLIPEASFSASSTTIEAKSTITFTDNSTNNPSLYTWNFEGGSPSYSNKPSETVLYEGAGSYGVTLTVRNEFGGNEIVKEGYIIVTAPPIIDIDTKAQLRYTFEDNLNSDLDKGLLNITATTSGAQPYSIRPGGGKAFDFNGSNPLIIPDYKGINGAGTRSVALWLKTTYAGGNSGLVHWGASGSFSRSSLKWNKTGTIRFEYQGGGHNGATVINDGTWHHVAYTYDGDTIKMYVDGIEDITVSGKVLRTGEAGETDVSIGSQSGGAIWQGSMDDVRIFDVVLTPAEVKVLSEMK